MAQPAASTSPSTPVPAPEPAVRTGRPPARKSPRKWRARLIVLLMVAAAVVVFVRLAAARTNNAALIDLGTVTLTAQPIPVETPQPGQVTEVSVRAEQVVKAGAKLGVIQVTTTNSDGDPVLSKLTLVAPRAGIVVDQPVTMGSTLQPGKPFVQLYDPADFTFVTDVPVADLPDLSPGMVAKLRAKGLDRTVKASVQRIVPRVTVTEETGAAPGFLRMVLVPTDAGQVRDLVPGLRFTGAVDTRTGPGAPKLVALR